MYNKFAKGDLIKITNPSITYPVSANMEMWDNNELRTFENLNRPIRNLFENNMETQFILDKIQAGIKMNANAVLTGCELVVSTVGSTNYVSVKPGLFYYDSKSYTVYPTPSIASRQLEKDLELETEDGIDFIKITYEGGKFKASISITKSLNPLPEATTNEFDRGIDLLNDIEAKIIASDSSLAPKFDSLENYALEPCFVIPTTETRYVNFNPSSKEIVLEETSSSLNFGFVDNFVATDNTNSRWVGLVEDSYKDNSITNVKLDDMEENTLKGNNAVPGDPKDLGKAEVVAMFNLVTRDAPQTIDGIKTFTEDQKINNTKKLIFKNQTGETGWNISNSANNTLLLKEGETERISIVKDNGAMTIANPISLSETLDVTGATTLASSLTVNASDAGEKIGLNGTTTITGDTAMTGKFTVTATATDKSINFLGPTNITGKVIITSKKTGESVFVEGNTRIKSLDDGTIELETPKLSTTSKTFVIGSDNKNNIATDGSGIVFKSNTDKTFLWENGTPEATASSFTSSENLNLKINKTYKIDDTDVLSSTTLGAGVINSSLETVGTITFGEWRGTTIAVNKGGTGATSYTAGDLLIGKTDGGLGIAKILGVEGGVNVVNGDGSITLNTPQPIAITSSPTFKELKLTGDLAVNGSAITTTKTTLDVLNTNLTGVLNFANVATTINMGKVANINIGEALNNKTVSVLGNKNSSDYTTGALVVSGGVGIGGNVFTDGNLTTTGKITSAGLKSTVTGASLEVATSGVNTTGNVKSTISSDKKFSIEKDGTNGNLLSVEHSGITANVAVSATENITSTKTITGKNFVSTGRRTGGILYEVSDINSLKFNDNTIKNTKNGSLTETDKANANLSLLWVDGAEQGEQIKKTPFSNFPAAYLNSDGETGTNGLMPFGSLIDIQYLKGIASFDTVGGISSDLLYSVNGKTSPAGNSGAITLYSDDIKLKNVNVLHADGTNESTTTIYDMFRDLRTEKERVKGHLPLNTIASKLVGQIIKKTKNTTDVTWGQITDDEIETTLTKVRPYNTSDTTVDKNRKVAFWSTDEKSLMMDSDITYNTSTNTLIAETVSSRSSRKLKKDIELYEKSAFDTIDKIDIVSYHFIADETQTDRVGFIAEDSPELVSGKDRDHMEMNNCIGLLLKAVQELKEENQELRKLINDRNS